MHIADVESEVTLEHRLSTVAAARVVTIWVVDLPLVADQVTPVKKLVDFVHVTIDLIFVTLTMFQALIL